MKLTIDLEKVEIKVLNIVEINDKELKGVLKKSIENWDSKEIVTQFEDNLALGIVNALKKDFSDKVRIK